MVIRAPDGANDNDNDNNCQGNNGGRVLFLVQQAYRWTIVTFFYKKILFPTRYFICRSKQMKSYQRKLPCTKKENQTQRKVVLIYNTYSQSDTGRSCKFGGDSVFQPAGSRLLDNSTSLCCISLFSGC